MTASALLHIAAECHRQKWGFEDNPEAFRALSRIGNMAKKAWEECPENVSRNESQKPMPLRDTETKRFSKLSNSDHAEITDGYSAPVMQKFTKKQ